MEVSQEPQADPKTDTIASINARKGVIPTMMYLMKQMTLGTIDELSHEEVRVAHPTTEKRLGMADESHRNISNSKEKELRSLQTKVSAYRKANASLKKELETFDNSEAMAQVPRETNLYV